MSCNNQMFASGLFSVSLHTPPASRSIIRDGKEVAQGLPPYDPCEVYSVEMYNRAIERWRSELLPDGSNYFCGIDMRYCSRGAWFDLNQLHEDIHHVATVIAVQGVNAISGPGTMVDDLQQYRYKCPLDNSLFENDRDGSRRCLQCGFSWPAQNYLASNVTPRGFLWRDGWWSTNGEVRQFFFSKDPEEGVAAQTIEDRTYYIDFSFFRSAAARRRDPELYDEGVDRDSSMESVDRGEDLEVGAGALVNQEIYEDTEDVDEFWNTKPSGKIRLFFVNLETAQKLLKPQRQKQFVTGGEGFLKKVGKKGFPSGRVS